MYSLSFVNLSFPAHLPIGEQKGRVLQQENSGTLIMMSIASEPSIVGSVCLRRLWNLPTTSPSTVSARQSTILSKIRIKGKLATDKNLPLFGCCRSRGGRRQKRINGSRAQAEDRPALSDIPRSIHDISNGDHILGFGANLSEDHPGFHDEEYKKRRTQIADLAKQHNMGEPIPIVQYTAVETEIWGNVLKKLIILYPTHACKEYLDALPLFNFNPEKIPQLQELSEILQRHTGWQIRPVAGLLHPRDFLNGLAFKTFHSTQYIRHGSNPMYTPEPDICHEILGHMPLLANSEFAELAQIIGLASLGATNQEIWHLIKLYWYTVEFGTIREGSEVKAFGAGLLSSFGELQYMYSGTDGGLLPDFEELNPFSRLPKMSYKDGFQKRYFLCANFADLLKKLRAYAKSIQHPEFSSYLIE